MADLNNIVNVQLKESPVLARKVNMNAVCLMTSDTSFLNANNRTGVYRSLAGVISDFGSGSVAEFATTFFAQSPNPVSADGYLVVGNWRNADEIVAATNATITGATITPTILTTIRAITDGSFKLPNADNGVDVTGLNFSTATNLASVISIVNANSAFTANFTAILTDGKVVITHNSTGAYHVSQPFTGILDAASGTSVRDLLKIGVDATVVNGVAEATLSAETPVEAVTACIADEPFKAFAFIDDITSAQSLLLSNYAQASEVLFFDTFTGPTALEARTTNPVWQIVLRGNSNTRAIYSANNNRKFSAAYMSKAHSVVLNASNSTKTMNLKTLQGVAAEDLNEGDILAAGRVGLDVYVPVTGVPRILTSGVNDFWDNRYNLIALVDAVKIDLFNLLSATTTKIPQTEAGIDALVSNVNQTCQRFVVNAFLAPGIWTSPDFFGRPETLKSAILQQGFYVLARPLSEQSQESRENRESPVIQVAIKGAGAVHSVQVIINFNK